MGVSVGVASGVLEWLAIEDTMEELIVDRGVFEELSDEELGVVSEVLDWLTEEDTTEEELRIGSDELEGLRVDNGEDGELPRVVGTTEEDDTAG